MGKGRLCRAAESRARHAKQPTGSPSLQFSFQSSPWGKGAAKIFFFIAELNDVNFRGRGHPNGFCIHPGLVGRGWGGVETRVLKHQRNGGSSCKTTAKRIRPWRTEGPRCHFMLTGLLPLKTQSWRVGKAQRLLESGRRVLVGVLLPRL